MFAESLLYSVPPAVYDLTNPYDLPFLHHYPIPTGPMGGWVKVPDYYSSIPRAPPCKHLSYPTGSGPSTSTKLQWIQTASSRQSSIISLTNIQLTSQHRRRLRNKLRYFTTQCASLTLDNSSGGPSVKPRV